MRSTCRVAHILNLGANQIGEVLVELVVLGLHILVLHSLRQDMLVETPADIDNNQWEEESNKKQNLVK